MAFDFNPREFKEDEVEGGIAHLIKPGWYPALLVVANPTEPKGKNANPCSHLRFEILQGEYEGKVVRHDLYHASADESKIKGMQENVLYWGKRLGLFAPDGAGGFDFAAGRTDFPDCVGDVDHSVWINVVIEEGQDGVSRNAVSMRGIKRPDEIGPDGKPLPRKKLPAGGAGGAAATAASSYAGTQSPPQAAAPKAPPVAAPKRDEFADV